MEDLVAQAAAESARRKVRRAAGLLKDTMQVIADLLDGPNVLGVSRAHDRSSIEDVQRLISLGVARHGAVDVVVIARPQGRTQHQPTTAADAAKESTDGTQRHDGEPQHA